MALKVHPHNTDHFAGAGACYALSFLTLSSDHSGYALFFSSILFTNPSSSPIGKENQKAEDVTMSRRNGSSPKLELKLNLSPPRANRRVESPSRSATVSPTSPPSSCVSSELNQEESLRYSNSPEATSMVLVGCPRCLMYVMLSEDDPKCPKCKSTVLLDFLHDNNNNNNAKRRS